MRRVSFAPRYYNNIYVGAVFLILTTLSLILNLNRLRSSDLEISALMFLVGVLLIGHALFSRLIFTDYAVVSIGVLHRTMLYADIVRADWGRVAYKSGAWSGYTGCVVLSDRRGRRVRLIPRKFSGYEGEQGWAALLLQAIGNNAIAVDTKTRQKLRAAAARTPSRRQLW